MLEKLISSITLKVRDVKDHFLTYICDCQQDIWKSCW